MTGHIRRSGINIIGEVPWGTHLCQFYKSKEELIDILVPYFEAGLDNNEFCMWVTSGFLGTGDAERCLRKLVDNLDDYIGNGQIEILDSSQWYTKQGRFDADQVLQGWVEKENQALKRGFDGLRVSGDTSWLEKREWKEFADYEAIVHHVIGEHRMVVICTYALEKCAASEIIDVVSSHQFALTEREGTWQLVESAEHRRAQKILQESEQKYRTIVDSTEDSIYLVDRECRYLFMNEKYLSRLGLPLDKVIERSYAEFHSEEETKDCSRKVKEVFETAKSVSYESRSQRDGKYFLRTLSPVEKPDGSISAVIANSKDITSRKQAEEKIKASLREKEVLLREIHHRVKNNMQVISSLLNLQSIHIKDKEALEMFKESQDRIRSMALIHEKLYRSKDLASIDIAGYIRDLTTSLIHSYGASAAAIKVNIDVRDIFLDITASIPCGLIINELVSNSLKHAFPDGREGDLKIAMHRTNGDKIELIVSDNGIGFPEDMDFRKTESLGMQVAITLVEQLDGTIELDRSKGTAFKIGFSPQGGK